MGTLTEVPKDPPKEPMGNFEQFKGHSKSISDLKKLKTEILLKLPSYLNALEKTKEKCYNFIEEKSISSKCNIHKRLISWCFPTNINRELSKRCFPTINRE